MPEKSTPFIKKTIKFGKVKILRKKQFKTPLDKYDIMFGRINITMRITGMFRNSTKNRNIRSHVGDDTWLRKNVSQNYINGEDYAIAA